MAGQRTFAQHANRVHDRQADAAASPAPAHDAEVQDSAAPASERTWHQLAVDETLDAVGSQRSGLTSANAQQRLDQHGPNTIGQQRQVSAARVLLHQFQSPLIYVLFGALAVTVGTSLFTGDSRWADAIVIGLVLVVNSTVGFLQEYNAANAVQALMKMIAPKARVRRDNDEEVVPARTLVPGDVVLLGEGTVVPADLRLIDAQGLQVDESALTGESVPVGKSPPTLSDADANLPPADQTNMAFMGTAVTAGKGEGVVVATSRQTQIGQIAQQVEEADETQTPLQRRIQRLAILITWGILIIAALATVTGLLMGRDLTRMLTLAVALAVAAIPAGLPIVVTVALAIGVRRMARRHAVIRHLPAVDTLGSCTTIVSDKTGTLTQNRMTVKRITTADHTFEVTGDAHSPEGELRHEGEPAGSTDGAALYQSLLAAALCNNASLPAQASATDDGSLPDSTGTPDEARGDPMEIALLGAARKAGLQRDELDQWLPRNDEIPFQTEKRYMAVTCDVRAPDEVGPLPEGTGPLVLVKGAPEAVLDMCAHQCQADGSRADLDRDAVMERNRQLAGEGLRVLAMAVGRGDEAVEAVRSDAPQGLTFVGMQGLLDPPRATAVEAVDNAHQAGIRVLMVTGDHARTAAAIAREVHADRPAVTYRHDDTRHASPDGEEHPNAHTGQELSDFDDAQLDEALSHTNVFARVKPIQKTRIVDRLKAGNQIVAVTGDGVNDAPALKSAHIGAAMGSGTDVAKEASDMVITDNDFASVYAAVELGRTAFRNIRMATFFLLSTGAADVLIILSALVLGWPLPLLPAQILWCNVVTNGIADVALAFEPGERALYRRPPRPPSEGVLDRTLLERLVLVGIWLAVGVLAVFLWEWRFSFDTFQGDDSQLTLARTAALTTLVLFQKVHVFNCRSEQVSIFRKSLFANKLLLVGVMTSLVVHVGAIYLPLTQDLLGLAPLDATTWLVALAVASTAIIVNELHKWLRPRYRPIPDARAHG